MICAAECARLKVQPRPSVQKIMAPKVGLCVLLLTSLNKARAPVQPHPTSTVDSKNLKHRFRTIYAGVPSPQGLEVGGQSY